MVTAYEMDGVDEAGGSRDKRSKRQGWSVAVWSIRLAVVEEAEIITATIACENVDQATSYGLEFRHLSFTKSTVRTVAAGLNSSTNSIKRVVGYAAATDLYSETVVQT